MTNSPLDINTSSSTIHYQFVLFHEFRTWHSATGKYFKEQRIRSHGLKAQKYVAASTTQEIVWISGMAMAHFFKYMSSAKNVF